MYFVIRFVMFLTLGLGNLFYAAHVLGSYMWPKFVHPVAPQLLVEKLDISSAIGFSLFITWTNIGMARLILDQKPEKEQTESEKLSEAFVQYLTSSIIISIFWGVCVIFF